MTVSVAEPATENESGCVAERIHADDELELPCARRQRPADRRCGDVDDEEVELGHEGPGQEYSDLSASHRARRDSIVVARFAVGQCHRGNLRGPMVRGVSAGPGEARASEAYPARW